MSFIGELKRRNVIRVAILYFISSWLLLQLTDVLSSILPVPEWTGSFVFMMLLIGLAPALIFAWVYEMTPDGLKRESDIDRSQSITPDTGKKMNTVIIVLLLLAITGMVIDRLIPEAEAPAAVPDAAADASGTSDAASIAVLPFADMSEAGDQRFFTDGLSEELLNLLVRVDGLSVASRTSAFAYRGSALSLSDIAGELGVAHVLEGSVRKSGDQIRITAQLIEANTDRHLWSDTFDRKLDDIFAIQDEIGTAIVEALKAELGILEEVTVNVTAVTSNMDAYELYLEARELFLQRSDLPESIRLFKRAIELDPEFAKAWEGLAAVEIVADGWFLNDGIDHLELALEPANKALELDPGLSLAHAVKAQYLNNKHAKIESMRSFDTALRNDPMNATAHLWRGLLLMEAGYLDEALAALEMCLEIDSGYLNCSHFLAVTYLYAGQPVRAIETYEPTLESNFHSMSGSFVSYYARNGNRALALVLADIVLGRSSAPVIEWIRVIEDPDGDHAAGYARLQQWERENDSGPGIFYAPLAYLAFGDFEAFVREPVYAQIDMWHPDARGFRRSPYFKELVRLGGSLALWQQRGFPSQCRPLGDDDFECDDPF